jgi:hypothetical protein
MAGTGGTRMRRLTIAVTAVACCVLGVTMGRPGAAAAGRNDGQSMYRAEVLGVLLAAQEMYKAGDTARWSGELQVEEASGGELKAGQVVRIEYTVAAAQRTQAPSAGEEVRCTLVRTAAGKGGAIWGAEKMPEAIGRGELIRPGEGATTDVGSPAAKILVKMFAPLSTDCHRETADMVLELARREPDKVRVQLYDMRSPQGRQEMQREGLTCATVLVNNRYQFLLSGPEGARKVAFTHRPNTPQSMYNSADVVALVNQEIERLY